MKTDLGFYIKKLENLLQRQAYKAYHGKNDNDYSLMNMWITDFLTDHESKDIFPKDIELQKKCIQMRDKIEEKLTVNLTEEEKKQFLIISKKIIDGMS